MKTGTAWFGVLLAGLSATAVPGYALAQAAMAVEDIDISEVRAARTAQFAALDVDMDGSLTAKELEVDRSLFANQTSIARSDMDFDGALDREEYVSAPMTLLTAMDGDADGYVTSAERDAFRETMQQRRGQMSDRPRRMPDR